MNREHAYPSLVAHELRTPLTCVSVHLEMLATRVDGEELELVNLALRSAHRMQRLVTDLLALSRLSAQRTRPATPVNLARVVDDVIEELEPLCSMAKLRIDVEPVVVLGLRDDLHRLILNLVENAFCHAPDATEVRVSAYAVQDTVVLAVEDDGPGVPASIRDRIFDRFTRAGDADGSGLGLAVVRETAAFLGGTARLERSVGTGGARFVVVLPAASAMVREAAAQRAG